ncbi:MAG: hypothetical protein K0R54_376 [Clostridiaceae bacterium]|nr:hypothetical protein [Clostridiaceae bacterium]
MDLNELIKIITAEVLKMLDKKVLLFISGGAVNIKDTFAVLNEYKLIKYSAVISNSAKEVIPEIYTKSLNLEILNEKKCIVKAINNSDLILIPVLTRNTLAKTALGIRDNYFTTGISEALMRNKKVIAVKDSCDPECEVLKSMGVTVNKEYNKMLIGYLKTLESFGVTLINSSQLKDVMNNELNLTSKNYDKSNDNVKKSKVKEQTNSVELNGVITMGELLSLNGNKEVIIAKDALITPLAKDYIDSEKIKIKYN